MKSYETKDSGGCNVCKAHGLLRCWDCEYMAELEADVGRLQTENDLLYNKASEYASLALWCAERLATRRDAEYAYDEIEKIYGYAIDREWRGEQV